jgi:hypothetical protein
MIKKRAMAESRWADTPRIETGYADDQPKWPYWVKPCNYSEPKWLEMNVWMLKTFGDGNWLNKNARWVGSNQKYWFRDERDRTLFLLRWT